MQAFDREQSYIRSQTSVAELKYSHQQETSQPSCLAGIYDTLIESFSGDNFKRAMDAVLDIEATLDQWQPNKFEVLKNRYATIEQIDRKLAERLAECIRQRATEGNLSDLVSFPSLAQPASNVL
jgi:hypothetical protein